ncbi:MAG: hypothetical protein ACYTER_09555 [Planctomycetota bacterium]|jgi:hypothetical protein
MNRTQKMAWMTVVCVGTGFLLSTIAVTILYYKQGFPCAWAGLGLLGLSGFSGLAPAVFKKEKGAVIFDERDRMIQLHSAKSGFAASYLVFGALSMGIWIINGPDSLINVNTLPQIWLIGFITAFFVQAMTTLILYGKDSKAIEGGAA